MKEKINIKQVILEGIPTTLPNIKEYDSIINHAPIRKDILSIEEKKLALKNALRYFPPTMHKFICTDLDQTIKFNQDI